MAMRQGARIHRLKQQIEIGQQVALARRSGVEWKVLEIIYQRSRTELWRYIGRAAAAPKPEFCNKIGVFCNTITPSETVKTSRSISQ